jgi:oxygen-independent coproporphyrinogen-3 oxidase
VDIIKKYIDALITEVTTEIKGHHINTIYIGGGTPSTIPVKLFEYLLLKLTKHINFDNVKEFTVEINPESTTEELINLFHSLGVNRISMGVQSFDDDVLYFLGRIHTSAIVYKAIEIILKFYCLEQISIDLIYDIPFVNEKKIFESIKQAVSLELTHLSAYNYTFESGFLKPFYLNYHEQMPHIIKYLKGKGYEQYEISNFCKNNNISKHNVKYWTMEEYIGIGASAHSMVIENYDRIRKENITDINSYIENPLSNKIVHKVDMYESLKEDIIFGLRYLRGTNIYSYLNITYFEKIKNELDKLILEDLVCQCKNTIKLTDKGIIFYDTVAERLWEC